MGVYDSARPDTEVFELDAGQRRNVVDQIRQRRVGCGSCGSRDFEIGNALYLGFLFTNEEHRDYMVGLTCTNPTCPGPRTGIRLHESEVFEQREDPNGEPARRHRRVALLLAGGLAGTGSAVHGKGTRRTRALSAVTGTVLLAASARQWIVSPSDSTPTARYTVVPRARFERTEPMRTNEGEDAGSR